MHFTVTNALVIALAAAACWSAYMAGLEAGRDETDGRKN